MQTAKSPPPYLMLVSAAGLLFLLRMVADININGNVIFMSVLNALILSAFSIFCTYELAKLMHNLRQNYRFLHVLGIESKNHRIDQNTSLHAANTIKAIQAHNKTCENHKGLHLASYDRGYDQRKAELKKENQHISEEVMNDEQT